MRRLLLPKPHIRQVELEPGRYARRSVEHPVATSDVLDFQGHQYDLRSVIVHLGTSLHSGHYIALTKHETDTGTWWLYNDANRREATREQVATTGGLRGWKTMKSYVLLYEKRPTVQ